MVDLLRTEMTTVDSQGKMATLQANVYLDELQYKTTTENTKNWKMRPRNKSVQLMIGDKTLSDPLNFDSMCGTLQ